MTHKAFDEGSDAYLLYVRGIVDHRLFCEALSLVLLGARCLKVQRVRTEVRWSRKDHTSRFGQEQYHDEHVCRRDPTIHNEFRDVRT